MKGGDYMVKIRVIEKAGKIMANVQIEQDDGSFVDYYLPKMLLDKIKADIPSLDLTALLSRESDNTYNLT